MGGPRTESMQRAGCVSGRAVGCVMAGVTAAEDTLIGLLRPRCLEIPVEFTYINQ